VAITLGKDCFIALDGGVIASARNVQLSHTARTIDINAYGVRDAGVYSTGYEGSVSVELNDGADLGSAYFRLKSGTSFTVFGGAGSWSFQAVLTGIQESDPVDGVATFVLEGRMTNIGIR
jgi:hypothetical protein